MRLDPVADLGCASEVGGQVRGDQPGWRILAKGRAIAERDVGQRDQQATVGDPARVGMLLRDPQADDEAAFRVAAVEQRPDRFEERAGAEQRLETGRRIGLAHRVIPGSPSLSH